MNEITNHLDKNYICRDCCEEFDNPILNEEEQEDECPLCGSSQIESKEVWDQLRDENPITYSVDIPNANNFSEEDQTFVCVATFETREEAIKFAQEKYGADENGLLNLISKY